LLLVVFSGFVAVVFISGGGFAETLSSRSEFATTGSILIG